MYSGSAIVNGVNAITPHFAGAVDILVVRQPDGSLKSTPFYGTSLDFLQSHPFWFSHTF